MIINTGTIVSMSQLVLLLVSLTLIGYTSTAIKISDHTQPNSLQIFHSSKIINEYFSQCDIYLTIDQDGIEPSTDLINDLASPSFPQLATSRFVLHLESYFEQNTNWNENCSRISCFQTSTKKYSQCSLILGIFTRGEKSLPVFEQLLIAPFQTAIKNEQDHFIFIVGGDNGGGSRSINELALDSFLKNPHLSTIKFKLGIVMNINDTGKTDYEIVPKTLCFFCNTGKWSAIIPIDLAKATTLREVFPDFSRNGHRHSMTVSGPPKYAFLYELEEVDGGWVSKRGVYKFFIESLLTHFNYTFTVFPSTGHGSGTQFSNGTWNGVVGDVLYGLADFGTSTSPNPARFPLISYTTAMIYPFVSFIIGPPKITYSWKAIYWPFTPDMWIAILISLCLIVIVFKVFQKVWKENADLRFYRHLVEYLSYTLIGQGLEYPSANSSRQLLAAWLFAALIFNTLYVSKIVGLLAFPIYQQQPKTFQQLVESDLSWGFDKSGGNLFAHFKSSSNPIFHKIFEKKEPEKDAIDCFNGAIKENFACVTWAGAANYVAYKNLTFSHGKSPLVFAEDITLFVTCGIAFPRRTLHRDNFDNIIGTLRDSGQVDKWIEKDLENLRQEKVHWQKRMNMTVDDVSGDNGPDLLSLSNLLGVFYFYIVGHVAAILFLVVEMVKKKKPRVFEYKCNVFGAVCR
ncbi:unnamed protein product [Orchesella dallaii]|uniref:Ionotropic glutamate receptor C-terminal domain-containing protein n=1 Tax=Orchesella dallaii TaxID=48710 RepID=A0ABP1QI45_9HEXA